MDALKYITEKEVNHLVNLMNTIGYDDETKNKFVEAIKNYNQTFKANLIEEAKSKLISETFSEFELSMIDYARFVIYENNIQYQTLIISIKEQLEEIDNFINEMLICKREEITDYKELIKLCFLELSDILNNYYEYEMGRKRK